MTTYDYLVSGSGKKIIPENMNNRDRDCSVSIKRFRLRRITLLILL